MNRVKDLPGIVMHCNQKVQDGKTLPASATHASYTLSNGNNENIEADVYLPAFAEFRSRSGYLSSLVGALEPNGLIKVLPLLLLRLLLLLVLQLPPTDNRPLLE
jgi:hypothetical protein